MWGVGWYLKVTNVTKHFINIHWIEMNSISAHHSRLPASPNTSGESSAFLNSPCPTHPEKHSFPTTQRQEEDGEHWARTPTSLTPSSLHLLSIRNPVHGGRWPIKAPLFPFVSGPVRDSAKPSTTVGPHQGWALACDSSLGQGFFWAQEKKLSSQPTRRQQPGPAGLLCRSRESLKTSKWHCKHGGVRRSLLTAPGSLI